MKNNNSTLLIVLGAAVVGYLMFRKGGALNQVQQINPATGQVPAAGFQKIPGVASELPSLPDIGIIAPSLDPTGMQITMY